MKMSRIGWQIHRGLPVGCQISEFLSQPAPFHLASSSPSPRRAPHTQAGQGSRSRIASPPARQADLPLHYLCISASPTFRFPNPAEHRNRRAPGAIKKGRPPPAKVKTNNHHRIAAGKASLASHHRAEGGERQGRGEAKASIKRRGGDEACRPNPSNFPPPPPLPSPPMPASRS